MCKSFKNKTIAYLTKHNYRSSICAYKKVFLLTPGQLLNHEYMYNDATTNKKKTKQNKMLVLRYDELL